MLERKHFDSKVILFGLYKKDCRSNIFRHIPIDPLSQKHCLVYIY